jgi:hypothetical protein
MDLRVRKLDGKMAVAFVVASWLLITNGGCGATSSEPCTQADLGKIVAAHEARLAEKCLGQNEKCEARKAEDARFKEEVRTWVRCDQP